MSEAAIQARILLLEDSTLDAELVTEALERGGIAAEIRRVWTREAFTAALAEEEFDIVLADYTLPEFDGLAALEIVARQRPELPFIIVSATLGEERAVDVMKRGATDFVMKERLARLPGALRRAFAEARERAARREAEARLRALNARLESLVEARTRERERLWSASPDLLLVCDLEGTCLRANPAWREALGQDPEALPGRRLEALLHPEDAAAAQAQLPAVAAGAVVRDLTARLRAADGSWRVYLWTWVKTAAGQFHAAGRDITERVEMEARLRQVQKMESIGQITGGVAHDFNNLLTVIIGGLETLTRRGLEGRAEAERVIIDSTLRAAQRAAGLTRSLLAFSRRQPLDIQPVDVGRLVQGMSALLDRTLGERIAVRVEGEAGLALARTDPNQLESALLNLAVNARDAMPEGGQLVIRSRARLLDEAWFQGRAELPEELQPGRFIEISVSDTGRGMDAATLAQAFEPFFTTKGEGHGTGLGLSQVYGFCRQSRGHAQITSSPGAGTTVTLLLPAAEPAARAARPAPEAAQDLASRAAERVLVVEDNPDVRRHAVGLLRELGYRPLEAGDGPEALALLEATPDVALLFTDLGLPNGMDGHQLAEAALQRRPGLPVLYVTAHASDAVLRDGAERPGVALLSKPYGFVELGRRLRALLQEAALAAVPPAAPQAPPRAPCILLVEDEPLVRMVTAIALTDAGYQVLEADSAGAARDTLRAPPVPPDAVILDIGLPDQRGDVLARELRGGDAGLPIILASGYVNPAIIAEFAGDARLRIVAKPYPHETLTGLLAELGVPATRPE